MRPPWIWNQIRVPNPGTLKELVCRQQDQEVMRAGRVSLDEEKDHMGKSLDSGIPEVVLLAPDCVLPGLGVREWEGIVDIWLFPRSQISGHKDRVQ